MKSFAILFIILLSASFSAGCSSIPTDKSEVTHFASEACGEDVIVGVSKHDDGGWLTIKLESGEVVVVRASQGFVAQPSIVYGELWLDGPGEDGELCLRGELSGNHCLVDAVSNGECFEP